MQRVLIIRSVSFQQLDKNIVGIATAFPSADFHLLTHSHGVRRARKYGELSGIVDYENPGNFSPFRFPAALEGERFDAVVVPVTNLSGAGFLNVFLLAARVRARRVYCCNLVSELRPLPRVKLLFQVARAGLFSLAALLLTGVSVLAVPFLLVAGLLRRRRKWGR